MLRRFGRVDDVIVASFLDAATEAFSSFAPEIPTSAGTVAVADVLPVGPCRGDPGSDAARGPAGPGQPTAR